MGNNNYQTLVIEGETINLNDYIRAERGNRFEAAKIKKAETVRVFMSCIHQHIKPVGRISEIIFVWFSKNNRRDRDNVEFGQKFIWDGLVSAGIIEGDGPKHTPGTRIHNHQIDSSRPRVEVQFR